MSEEKIIGPYHDEKCAICHKGDAAYIVPNVNGVDQHLCWTCAKGDNKHIPQKRNPVGTQLKLSSQSESEEVSV